MTDGESSKTESRSDSYERTDDADPVGFAKLPDGPFRFGCRAGGPRMGVVLVVTISKEPRFRTVVVVSDIDLSAFTTRLVDVLVACGGLRAASVDACEEPGADFGS